jgi:UDP-N-acetylmuramoylalanine--D-glutamate ligase
LELGWQQAKCLTVAIAGTNGKGTIAGLVERLLTQSGRKAIVCGHQARPLCAAVEQSKDQDFLILQVNSFQLERTQYFRPAVAVLLNLAPDHLDRYPGMADYVRANARLFANQQAFDWVIVQSEALAQLQALNLPLPGKIISFSATDRKADIWLDRGLLQSRLGDWPGPLLDMDHCQLRGSHNAENLMAALAVGHVLRLPLDAMVEAMKSYVPGPHRCELVAEIGGVKYINDSKATNVDAMSKGLLAAPLGQGNQPNVWLIAGGQDKGLDFHAVGPLLSQRVKSAFLLGEAREKIRAAWGLFTPCTLADSLLEAVAAAAKQATPGDVVLLSPACSNFEQFRNYQHRGEVFRQAVESIGGGGRAGHPN